MLTENSHYSSPLHAQNQSRTAAIRWGLAPWNSSERDDLAVSQYLVGRLTELSGVMGGGGTSWAASLICAAQRASEHVAWIQSDGGSLYPPDMAAAGVDLDALVVVRTPKAGAKGIIQQLRATELLLRSGGFGLIIMDWLSSPVPEQVAWQGRLLALARQYRSAVVMLTNRPAREDSLGPLVQWRLHTQQVGGLPGESHLAMRVLKQKGQSLTLGWPWQLRRCGPSGLLL